MKPEDRFSEETSGRSGPDAGGHLQYLLTAYLFESISAAGRREVDEHLEGCAECRKELEELRSTLAQVQYTLGAGMEGEKLYSFEAHRIQRVLAASKERPTLERLRSWKVWVPLAAGLLIVAMVWPSLRSARGRADRQLVFLRTAARAPASQNAAPHQEFFDRQGGYQPAPRIPPPVSGPQQVAAAAANPRHRYDLLFDATGSMSSAGDKAASDEPAASNEEAPAEIALVGTETTDRLEPAEKRIREGQGSLGAIIADGSNERGFSALDSGRLFRGKETAGAAAAPAKPTAPAPEVAALGKLLNRRDAQEPLVRELKEPAAPAERVSEISKDQDATPDLGRFYGTKAPISNLGRVAATPAPEGDTAARADPAATPPPASESAQVGQLDAEKLFDLTGEFDDGKKRENVFGGIAGGAEAEKAYKQIQDHYQKLNTGDEAVGQLSGWSISRKQDGKAGEPGQVVDPRLENALRAYSYYRALDPTLTPQQFSVRVLSIPAPVVGDEGLGEEGFKKRYGVNPFVDTRRDHLSTFGMDVDTASYTLARSLLRAGKLPDPKTVRVEEFVNHFQEECSSDPNAVFSVFSEGVPSPFGEGLDLLKVTVKARELHPNERKDAVLTFAVDASGSMNLQNRLSLVREALKTLVGSLGSADRVAIIGFDAHAYLVLPHTTVRERERILGAIDSLAPGGGTNVEAGLDLAYRVADEAFQARAVNRVILCSDGVANAGARGPEDVLKKVRVFADRGLYISCVGFGMGRYNDAMLETLAKRGNGNYAYVDSPAAAEDIFRKNLPGTLQVLAQDAKVQVDFNPELVSHYRLLGYERRDIADQDFRNDKVDSGDVGPGTSVTVLYEVQRQPRAAGDLGRIHLRYRDTGTSRVDEVSYPLSPGVLATSLKESSDRLRFIACVAETAELLRGSYWARDGSFVKVLGVLGSLSPQYRARPEWNEVAELVGRAQALSVARMAAK